MLDNSGCASLQFSGLHSPRLGANYVSPLQKAVSRDPKSSNSTWLEQCYDVVVSSAKPDLSLSLPIDGGADSGMFCVIGSQVDPARLLYHDTGQVKSAQSQVKPGDIILSFNQYEISGYTRRDAIELCDCLTRVNSGASAVGTRPQVRIRLSPPHALPTGSTMLSSFLAAAFSLNSPEYMLQEKIRENVYQRVVPCTTRLPRADEVDGVHYRFMSVPQFLALERSGQLLESGVYKGNHYGTPRPEPNATALESVFVSQLSVSTSSSVQPGDDSCAIPPPVPPLASFTSVTGQTISCDVHSHPSIQHAPPRPPVRQSSISTRTATSKDKPLLSSLLDSGKCQTNGSTGEFPSTSEPTAYTSALNPSAAISGCSLNDIRNKSYFLDCDLTHSHHLTDRALETSSASKTASTGASEKPLDSVALAGWNAAVERDKPLPYGWEVIRDPNYGTFYIDHIHERTQYEPPTEEDYAMAAALQAQFWGSFNNNDTSVINRNCSSIQMMPTTTGSVPGPTPSTSALATFASDRVSPTSVPPNIDQLRGPLVTTTLTKGSKGFGFTIVGGADCEQPGFLQIKHLIPGGPASMNRCLAVGDVLVLVNTTNVLGYTHAELVALLQSIPVDSHVQLTVSQASRVRSERPESGFSDSSLTPSHTEAHESKLMSGVNATRDSSVLSTSSSHTSNTASPHLSTSPSSSFGATRFNGEIDQITNEMRSPVSVSTKPRFHQRPEFLKVAIVKQLNGFGFTLADHPQGQHVKTILDPVRCGQLRVGDVLVEINDQRVREIPHAEVVQILKQCPVGQDARLLIQRGGLYTSPLSLLGGPEHGHMDHRLAEDKTTSPPATQLEFNAKSNALQLSRPADVAMTNSINSNAHENSQCHVRAFSGGLVDVNQPRDHNGRLRSRTPDASLADGLAGFGDTRVIDARALHLQNSTEPGITVDRRRRHMQPLDDSVLDMVKTVAVPGSPTSAQYGSLLRPGRMLPLHQTSTDGQAARHATQPSFLMLPGEFLVHLRRQSTGFGFNVVGGAEENSQVVIGSLIAGGSAQMSGVVRSGDRLVSINGMRVVGAKHRDVVQLLEQAAHTVGQVTLGLQRPPKLMMNGTQRTLGPSCESVEVVVPRSHKGDGFGFFISNTHPSTLSNGVNGHLYNQSKTTEGEFIAQLVPGSKAEQLGLLSIGDRIVAVNKVPITGLHHDHVVRLIRESGSHIVLDIIPSSASTWASKPPFQPPHGAVPVEFQVTLFRGARGFGFSIRGGHEFDKMPLLVLRIVDGGAAQLDGRLKVGDELIEINGYSTVGMSHGRAIEIIQAGGNTMRLTVRRQAVRNSGNAVALPHQRHTTHVRTKVDHPTVYGIHDNVLKKRDRYSVPRPHTSTRLPSCAPGFSRSYPMRYVTPSGPPCTGFDFANTSYRNSVDTPDHPNT